MNETNYSAVDFSTLSATDDGKTLLYANDQLCQSISSLSEVVDSKIENKGYATETAVNNTINALSGTITADYATKNELGTVSDAVDELSGTVINDYATKEDLGKVGNFIVTSGDPETFEPVLDPTSAETKSIYLVQNDAVSGKDQYYEWIVTENDDTKEWTCIGETTIDLSDYAKTADVEAELALKQDILTAGTDLVISNGIIGVNTNGTASGTYSFVEGNNTKAKGEYSHAEGLNTFAADVADHVEGIGSYAEQGGCNHIEGFQYHSYMGNGPASNFYGTNKVRFYNTPSFTVNGNTINGSLYELVKAFKDKFIVSCEYGSSTEYHYTRNSFFKPKLYKIIDVTLDEETNQFEITIDGIFDCQSGGSIQLMGPTSITGINGGGGPLNPGQVISTFTSNGLGFPGNSLENVRPDNCFLSFTVRYIPAGASTKTSFNKIIKPTSITYNSTTNVYTYECEESIEMPSDASAGEYSYGIYVLNTDYYGCNHIEGIDNVIKNGECSHAEGGYNYINGSYSHAEGSNTSAYGSYSHTEGVNTRADGSYSHAEGYNTVASNGVASYQDAEHAEGYQTSAFGRGSHSEGTSTIASANGGQCHAEGYMTSALADHAHTEGQQTKANGSNSHAEGYGTSAVGVCSHTEGANSIANGDRAHAEGYMTSAVGINSHAEGNWTSAVGQNSHTEGESTSAVGAASHAEGIGTSAVGNYSHAEGFVTSAVGNYSHVEGYYALASGNYSHAEGISTSAVGNYSHAEGGYTSAVGIYSHAEGNWTSAVGECAHAEGWSTQAVGDYSHAEGGATSAAAVYAHAEGEGTIASGRNAHAEGKFTIAGGEAMHVGGKYNSTSSNAAFVIGNGTGATSASRSDAFIVDWAGVASATTLKNADGTIPTFIPTASQPASTTACSMFVDANGKFYIVTANA